LREEFSPCKTNGDWIVIDLVLFEGCWPC